MDQNFDNSLVPLSISNQTVGEKVSGIGSSFIPGLGYDENGLLYVSTRDSTSPGIVVVDPKNNQVEDGPVSTGLPPFELVFLKF